MDQNNNNSLAQRSTAFFMSSVRQAIDYATGQDEIDKLPFSALDALATHYEREEPPQPVDGFNNLPREILERILDSLEWEDIGRLLQASKYDHWVGAHYLDHVLRKYKIEVDDPGERPPAELYHVISLGRARRRADRVLKRTLFSDFTEKLQRLHDMCNNMQDTLARGLIEAASNFIPDGYYPYEDPNGGPPVTGLPGPHSLDPVNIARSQAAVSRYFPNKPYDDFLIGHYIIQRGVGGNPVRVYEVFDAMWMLQALKKQIRQLENHQDWPEGLRWGKRFQSREVSNIEEENPDTEVENYDATWHVQQYV